MGDFVKDNPIGQALTFASAVAAGAILGGPAGAFAAASTLGSLHAGRMSRGAQQVELDLQARQEAAGARDREVQRKRRLTAILGEQSALAAARGTQMSGSVANISIEDAKRASEDSMIDRVNTSARIDALSRRRNTLGRLSTVRAATTIADFAARQYERG